MDTTLVSPAAPACVSWYRVTVASGWAWTAEVCVEATSADEACARLELAGARVHRTREGLRLVQRIGDRYVRPLGAPEANGDRTDRRRLPWGADRLVTVEG
jgi:hypothetical protein